jgi:ABC-2 type transport system permease protein
MEKFGANAQQVQELLSTQPEVTLVATKNDGSVSQGYTYILMMLLYMTILIYGGVVSSSVAAEKSSRAMELLITSAKPGSLMFGKVLGVGTAGLCQMTIWAASAYIGYILSGRYWENSPMITSFFEGGDTRLLVYTLIFFILGYLLYSFLFGAMGSLVSRTEDLQITSTPLTMLVVAAFLISYFSTVFNYVDSTLMKVLSYIPFTSPLAMFIRILNNGAESWEIMLSIVVLIAGIAAVGVLAAAIYRVGVLLYGKPPKLGELFKILRKR